MKISYMDEPEREYAAALSKVKSLGELRLLTEKYRRIANDAYEIAIKMTADDFKEFTAGLRKERRGVWAGEDFQNKYADIIMPATMFQVTILAEQFKVPFWLAFIRASEAGLITESASVATFKRPGMNSTNGY